MKMLRRNVRGTVKGMVKAAVKNTVKNTVAMRILLLFAAAAAFLPTTGAQVLDPVRWSLALEPAQAEPGGRAAARLTAVIDDGWHLYSSTTPQGKPIALNLKIADSPAVVAWQAHQPEPTVEFDPNFQMDSEWYEHSVEFFVEIDLAEGIEGEHLIEANVRYGACDDRQCLPPKRKSAAATLTVAAGAEGQAVVVPENYSAMKLFEAAPAAQSAAPAAVVGDGGQGLFGFALVALSFGLLAILTPCVFPMIPIYMGSFLGAEKTSSGAVMRQAGLFSLGVVVLFTALGAGVSAIAGPFGMSRIGSNVWVNLLIAMVLFAFAASMLGAFEITMPSSVMTAANQRTSGSGAASTLMLSFVFTLASFACTGPFMGSLLAGSLASGSAVYPVFGMLMFSIGLAAPFFAIALFPSLLGKLPRSGGWLAVTKRTMGLVIFAVGVKYLSTVDQVFGWNLLTRERFLAIWIVLLALAALYLWGVVRLREDAPTEGIGLTRLGAGAAFLILALSLIPGMFGARLGELDAYVPSAKPSGLFAAGGMEPAVKWIKDDFDGALAEAGASGKPLLVNFTGYSCTNCKWMKTNMFTKPEVEAVLKDLVLVELYTDGLDDVSDRHQQLQISRFNSSTIPFYAVIRPDGTPAGTFAGQTRNVAEFLKFLTSGS